MKNRILVVEDDTAISELICMNLTVAGYDTEALFDGNEVEELVKNGQEFRPGPSGRDASGKRRLRADGAYEGGEDPGDLSHGEERRGLEDPGHFAPVRRITLSSPFEVLELLVRVEKVLERTGRQISRITVGTVSRSI